MQSDLGLASDMEGKMNVCRRRHAGLRKGLAGSGAQCAPGKCLKTLKLKGTPMGTTLEVVPGNTAHKPGR